MFDIVARMLKRGPPLTQGEKPVLFAIVMKIGILGGGQLGRMLLQAGASFDARSFVMDKESDCPAAHLCHRFVAGDIMDYDDVMRFGRGLDAVTIEIESVNEEALKDLASGGTRVYPDHQALRTIKDKARQKEFLAGHGIPTAPFTLTNDLSELADKSDWLPAVHKVAVGGYDGKGVRLLTEKADISKGFDQKAVLEKQIGIVKELSVIVSMNERGELAMYPPTEMVFDARLNLLDYQIAPARLPKETLWKAEAIAMTTVKKLKSPGIFAVELFVDNKNEVLVNEIAPRVHNSGHHTIEASYCSQFQMVWRLLLGLPLGNPKPILPSAMVNLIGSEGHVGTPVYEGLDKALSLGGTFVHLYGKKETRPGRKMGHVTILGNDYAELAHKARSVKETLRTVAQG